MKKPQSNMLKIISACLPKKPVLEILGYCHARGAEVYCTDMDNFVSVPNQSGVKDGTYIISGGKLLDVHRPADEAPPRPDFPSLICECDAAWKEHVKERKKSDKAERPQVISRVVMKASELISALEDISPAMSTDETRYILNGIHWVNGTVGYGRTPAYDQ